jgi:preprotein translocase subunit SecF
MSKSNHLLHSFLSSVITVLYMAVVILLMSFGSRFFGQGVLGGVAVLLLFVLSATVVGSLVLGKPVLVYLDGRKKEAVIFLFYNVGWLFLWLTALLLGLALWNR